jgi:hypothetical protein
MLTCIRGPAREVRGSRSRVVTVASAIPYHPVGAGHGVVTPADLISTGLVFCAPLWFDPSPATPTLDSTLPHCAEPFAPYSSGKMICSALE